MESIPKKDLVEALWWLLPSPKIPEPRGEGERCPCEREEEWCFPELPLR